MELLEARTLMSAYFLTSLGKGSARAIDGDNIIVGAAHDKPVLWELDHQQRPAPRELSTQDGIANGINDNGQIVGQVGGLPFVHDGSIELLDGMGSANAINSGGTIVGQSANRRASSPTVWSPDQVQLSQRAGTIHAINDAGQMVGHLGGMAVLWDGTVTELFPGVANDVNESGVVVGVSEGRPVRWSATEGKSDLGAPYCIIPGYSVSSGGAVGNNDVGQIVGNFVCTNPDNGRFYPNPALYENGQWTPLMAKIVGYNGFAFPTEVHDINNDGTMVGDSRYPWGPPTAFAMTVWHGFMDSKTGEDVARLWFRFHPCELESEMAT